MTKQKTQHFGAFRRAISDTGNKSQFPWRRKWQLNWLLGRVNRSRHAQNHRENSTILATLNNSIYFISRTIRGTGVPAIKAGFLAFLYRTLVRNRAIVKPLASRLSDWLDNQKASDTSGEKLIRLSIHLQHLGWQLPCRLIDYCMLTGLIFEAQVHRVASQYSRMLKTARLINLLFRPYIRERRNPASICYFQILLHMKLYERICREFPKPEELDSEYLAFAAGVAHLYLMNLKLSEHFLKESIDFSGNYYFYYRMLGRLRLIQGRYDSAVAEFKRSVELFPSSVMGHQNYAGRYNRTKYEPKQWELTQAGELLIYDNLVQLAEDFFLQGDFRRSFSFYQSALQYQSRLREAADLPKDILSRLEAECDGFDPSLPVRILAYEWVTQFGHIGLLDSYRKMALIDMIPKANYVVLAPRNKVSNPAYLAYWDKYFCIVRDEAMVDELFPYQRYFGDQFMALPSEGELAEPWTRAAAKAQIDWAIAGRGPLLQLAEEHKRHGDRTLRKLGIPSDAWYVGLHVREGGFYGDGTGTISEHRSAKIEDYFGAIDEVTSRGGWVVRLGDSSMIQLPAMQNVVDYVHSGEKSTLMDLFFLATCRFVIGTTSGLSTVAMSFGTPMLLVNCISNDWQIWTAETDFIVKNIYDRNEHRYLSLAETYRQPFQANLINHDLLRRRGIAVHSNSQADITAAVRYKLDVMLGVAERADDDHPLIQRYRESLSDNPFMFGAARPVPSFLEAHPELLEPQSGREFTQPKKHSAA